jgi:hypothetical protein
MEWRPGCSAPGRPAEEGRLQRSGIETKAAFPTNLVLPAEEIFSSPLRCEDPVIADELLFTGDAVRS